MKIVSLKAVFTTLCMGIAFIGAAQKATYNDTLMLSLDKCITIALSDNPSIKVADMEIERMDYYNKEVLGQLLPSISFNAQYSRTLAKQVMYLNMGALGGGASSGTTGEGSESEGVEETPTTSAASKSSGGGGIKMGLDNSYTMGFSASMPLVAP